MAGIVGCGGGPPALLFPSRCLEAAGLEEGKGDHRHLAGRELDYVFVSVDQLLDDFERDVQDWSSQ